MVRCQEMSEMGELLVRIRRSRMWTQGRLAREAGVSPTTVSGIETGRIARPRFETVRKLARALEVEPERLLAAGVAGGMLERGEEPVPLSLEWARSVGEEEFERRLEVESLERLESFLRRLDEERRRLQELYGRFPEDSEQRRFVKRQIRRVSAQFGSVSTSMMFRAGENGGSPEHGRSPAGSRRSGPGRRWLR
ncbi:XRE family transcriptional regulator [Rubrobacter taiwanensis]|uniref:XRE family transcriptional regulator n=2 Tax=Rubrobacter taiwanensis TaxID=185139 RepID=A0A4R1B224_9ACTN|nr:XRE family transcriptional regulator [Rubrobacter taiwanensis]